MFVPTDRKETDSGFWLDWIWMWQRGYICHTHKISDTVDMKVRKWQKVAGYFSNIFPTGVHDPDVSVTRRETGWGVWDVPERNWLHWKQWNSTFCLFCVHSLFRQAKKRWSKKSDQWDRMDWLRRLHLKKSSVLHNKGPAWGVLSLLPKKNEKRGMRKEVQIGFVIRSPCSVHVLKSRQRKIHQLMRINVREKRERDVRESKEVIRRREKEAHNRHR